MSRGKIICKYDNLMCAYVYYRKGDSVSMVGFGDTPKAAHEDYDRKAKKLRRQDN